MEFSMCQRSTALITQIRDVSVQQEHKSFAISFITPNQNNVFDMMTKMYSVDTQCASIAHDQ